MASTAGAAAGAATTLAAATTAIAAGATAAGAAAAGAGAAQPAAAIATATTGMWVFGLPIEAERIFLSDAGGRGDVTFGGEGQQGLDEALRDDEEGGVAEAYRRQMMEVQEGFFEDDVEVLDFAR